LSFLAESSCLVSASCCYILLSSPAFILITFSRLDTSLRAYAF